MLIILCLSALAAAAGVHFLLKGQLNRFYSASRAELSAGAPGSLIRAEPLDIDLNGARAWRVLYRSTGVKGQPVAVSGVIVAPDAPAPAGGYPVIAWAHPTTGLASRCAPSLLPHFAATVPALPDLIARGYVVTATDYEGLGTQGPHPYLVGISAAHSVLDSVRAADALAQTSGKFAVWGHSQGGHAALWTGKLAGAYAPDRSLQGVIAAAPATELSALFEDDLATAGGKVFTTLALLSWADVYHLDLDHVLRPEALPSAHIMANACMTGPVGLFLDSIALRILPNQFLKEDPTKVEPWRDIIAHNTPGDLPPEVPIFIAQGTGDGVVLPRVTRNFAQRLCASGSSVELLEMQADHLSIAPLSAEPALDWLADRLAGKPSAPGCTNVHAPQPASPSAAKS
ncbi:lipase family protein [Rhodoligotrophos defluvii]|uniref:lipase family protein n=1 Tax=Rhodoligotrophos defluvii TaxID=2561934 RepID=UPI0014853630|nr:lipase family protein [Rhodoligotrophos defluvii]